MCNWLDYDLPVYIYTFYDVYGCVNVHRVVELWREDLAKTNAKTAQSLADPTEYENLFPELKQALQAEQFLKRERNTLLPAASLTSVPVSLSLFSLSLSLALSLSHTHTHTLMSTCADDTPFSSGSLRT